MRGMTATSRNWSGVKRSGRDEGREGVLSSLSVEKSYTSRNLKAFTVTGEMLWNFLLRIAGAADRDSICRSLICTGCGRFGGHLQEQKGLYPDEDTAPI